MGVEAAVDPFALDKLLPVGIVRLGRDIDNHFGDKAPTTAHYSDWSSLAPFLYSHRIHLSSSSSETFSELDVLERSQCLKPQWRFRDGMVHVRVYLVPHDLAGVQGRLAMKNRKSDELLTRKERMKSLLCKVVCSLTAWEDNNIGKDDMKVMAFCETDKRSLSEIYSDLSSPVVDPTFFLSRANPNVKKALIQALSWDRPPGMRNSISLYTYQRRTLARMLQQELQPNDAPDPLYVPLHSVHNDKTFYLQPVTMELLREVPRQSQVKGGILCEEMGSGKTCIVLALILATRDQLSMPEEELGEAPKTVLTATALCHFPTSQFRQEREIARMNHPRCGVPTLRQLAMHLIRVSPAETCFEPGCMRTTIEEVEHMAEDFRLNIPFYHVNEREPTTTSGRRRNTQIKGPRRIYLTTATLVIVPRSLVVQWRMEIQKHCVDGLRLYASDIHGHSTVQPLPAAKVLASEYDIVLLTHERFSAESGRCKFDELPEWRYNSCHGQPYCETADRNSFYGSDVSSLIQIRWKRLVVDEGHVSAASNDVARLCSTLNVERRWIVSGTPTRNLMGLSLGQTSEPLTPDSTEEDIFLQDSVPDGTPSGTDAPNDDLEYPEGIRARPWASTDRHDLNKLSQMLSLFLKVPQFRHKIFREHVVAPLLHPQGPRYGSIRVLSQVMSIIMFRHQLRDIEKELPHRLPVLKEKTVKLEFHPLAALSYNALQAGIAVNAVDSEREGQDYFFHASSRGALAVLLENLRQTMFWRTDASLFDIDNAVERTATALETAIQRGRPPSDIQLVEDSLRVQRQAQSDKVWRVINQHEDCPFTVHGLSDAMQRAWLKKDTQGDIHLFGESSKVLLDQERLLKLRTAILHDKVTSEEGLIVAGNLIERVERTEQTALEEYQRSRKRKSNVHSDGEDNHKVKEFTAKTNTREIHELTDQDVSPDVTDNLPNFMVGDSVSSKLNYVLRKVKKHAAAHKFLIFSALPLSLALTGGALDMMGVPYCVYTSLIKPNVRQHGLLTFETSDKVRVLLVELKLGARGLNMVTASRIIFCEPVWQGDVEAQAIKRAHRIGQKCGVLKVTTLVMRGTSEEAMVNRRKALKNKSQKLPSIEEDVGMRKFLQNPTFLRDEDMNMDEGEALCIPLIPKSEAASASQSMDVDIEVAERPTKRPRVRFA